jgi:hypothetical protein
LLIPRVSSERRSYIPIGYINSNVIANDQVLTIENAQLYHFALLTSKMHMTWVKYTCGRLKSDYRYSKDVVYNNYPWPGCGDKKEIDTARVEEASQAVLDARNEFQDSSLADLYDPNTMPPVLVKAHQSLDKAVDNLYGYKDVGSEADRIAFLFEMYGQIVKK